MWYTAILITICPATALPFPILFDHGISSIWINSFDDKPVTASTAVCLITNVSFCRTRCPIKASRWCRRSSSGKHIGYCNTIYRSVVIADISCTRIGSYIGIPRNIFCCYTMKCINSLSVGCNADRLSCIICSWWLCCSLNRNVFCSK